MNAGIFNLALMVQLAKIHPEVIFVLAPKATVEETVEVTCHLSAFSVP
jgi:hypothetical protein